MTADLAGAVAATGVSTVGESAATGAAGTSSGLAGVPAAMDSFEATTGACIIAVVDSAAREVVASMPATAGRAAGGEGGTDLVLGSFGALFAATAVPGIGLGSIAGKDSVCADITAAASVAGATEATIAGLCTQPRS